MKNKPRHELLKEGWRSSEYCQLLIPPIPEYLHWSHQTQSLYFTIAVQKILFTLNLYSSVSRSLEYHALLSCRISWVHAIPLGLAWVGSLHLPLNSGAHIIWTYTLNALIAEVLCFQLLISTIWSTSWPFPHSNAFFFSLLPLLFHDSTLEVILLTSLDNFEHQIFYLIFL